MGQDLKTTHADLNILQGTKQLPGREQILFTGSDPAKLYLFDPSDDSTTELADLAALAIPGVGGGGYGLRDIEVIEQ